MTLEELKRRCKEEGFRYAYGKFDEDDTAENIQPPHLVAICTDTENFMADNKVYLKKQTVKLDYTYIEKDIDAEEKIENKILGDIPWNKTDETYLEDEDVWQISYFFEI